MLNKIKIVEASGFVFCISYSYIYFFLFYAHMHYVSEGVKRVSALIW